MANDQYLTFRSLLSEFLKIGKALILQGLQIRINSVSENANDQQCPGSGTGDELPVFPDLEDRKMGLFDVVQYAHD